MVPPLLSPIRSEKEKIKRKRNEEKEERRKYKEEKMIEEENNGNEWKSWKANEFFWKQYKRSSEIKGNENEKKKDNTKKDEEAKKEETNREAKRCERENKEQKGEIKKKLKLSTSIEKDLDTLKNQNWVNDEVINQYFNIIKEENERKRKIHIMNTFFSHV